MRSLASIAVAIAALSARPFPPARRPRSRTPPAVERSASGTIIQPTTTIIPDGNGHRTIIIIPRRRSYLDPGTEVSVGDGTVRDYMLPPGGDPGRSNWFAGPDVQGTGRYPLPSAFDGTGINPNTPF